MSQGVMGSLLLHSVKHMVKLTIQQRCYNENSSIQQIYCIITSGKKQMAYSNSDIGNILMNKLIAKAWLRLRKMNMRQCSILVSHCQPGIEGLNGANGDWNRDPCPFLWERTPQQELRPQSRIQPLQPPVAWQTESWENKHLDIPLILPSPNLKFLLVT